MRTDDMHAEYFVVLTFADDLYKAFFFAKYACFAGGGHWKLANLHIVTLLTRFCFR
jgi:hypothetical protein